MEDEKIIAGFNAGYLLAKYEPKIMDGLTNAQPFENEFLQGMKLGKKEHEKEIFRERVENAQKKDRGKHL